MIEAVIFDLDGVLVETEETWDTTREAIARELGGRWHPDAHRDMMGMSSTEWSAYMHTRIGVPLPPERINDEVVRRLSAAYRRRLPLLPGAVRAVEAVAGAWPLAVASSSNRPLIELILELAGVAGRFRATVSSEEVPRGKPAPDVYLEAARRLGAEPDRCVAIEDSHNGILAAARAGMAVVAIPSSGYPPGDEALRTAHMTLPSVAALDRAAVERAAATAGVGA